MKFCSPNELVYPSSSSGILPSLLLSSFSAHAPSCKLSIRILLFDVTVSCSQTPPPPPPPPRAVIIGRSLCPAFFSCNQHSVFFILYTCDSLQFQELRQRPRRINYSSFDAAKRTRGGTQNYKRDTSIVYKCVESLWGQPRLLDRIPNAKKKTTDFHSQLLFALWL